MLLSIDKVNKGFGDKPILKELTMTIEEHCRYGLIGVNGAGKSTLLNIISGDLAEDSGEVYRSSQLTIGFLRQNSGLDRTSTILAEMRGGFADALQAEEDMRALEQRMAQLSDHESAEYRQIAAEYAKKQAYFDSRDGYGIDVKIKMILNGMGFSDKDMDTSIHTLSGGEKTRLAIAKLLLEEPNLLILDEPTNHLDFKTLNWLEEYLLSYNGSVLVVSHDRYFLDKVVEHIFELERGKLVAYKGNYSRYLVQREERRVRLEKEYEMQQVQIAHMQDYIDKNLARASTSNSAKSRIKALENMEMIEKPDGELKAMNLRFTHTKEPYKDVLSVRNLEVAVGEGERRVSLCSGVNLNVRRGEKIAVIGENGIGKSSFFKTLLGFLPPEKGEVEWGGNTSVSYYEQENLNLDPEKIALDELWDRFPSVNETDIRKALGSVLLTKDDVYKPVKVISGGERAKLAFCIIMLEQANVLLLDEPTNHLDLPSKEVLERALLEYGGTLLFISHDRYLLNKVPDKIIEITADGIVTYDGKFEYYQQKQLEQARAQQAAERAEVKPAKQTGGYRSKEQRRQDVQRKQRIRELESLIENLETQNSELEQEMAHEEVFSDYQRMSELCTKLEENKAAIESAYLEWTELSEEA